MLLPVGAIVARYCKQWDPLWYYLHAVIQLIGFIFGLAAVVAGVALYDKLHANVTAHRGLGIFVLVLGILQVSVLIFYQSKNISEHLSMFLFFMSRDRNHGLESPLPCENTTSIHIMKMCESFQIPLIGWLLLLHKNIM